MPAPPIDYTKLGRAFAAKADAPAGPASKLLAALAGARPKKPFSFVVNGMTITGEMILLGVGRELDIEGEVLAAMEERGLRETPESETAFELERATRVLTDAALDESGAKLGPLTLWRDVPKEVVANLYQDYLSHAAANDPAAYPLTAGEREAIAIAFQKKSEMLLRAFGARRLARFMTTSESPPASSPSAMSSHGDSSSAS